MLKGDLATTPLPEVLRQLADGLATGCLHVLDPDLDPALIYFRGGSVYAVSVPGRRPELGTRLISSGDLAPEALAEALEAQRTELQGWKLSELLVHLGYVDQPVIKAFIDEQIRASMSDLLGWRGVPWKFRINQRTREDVAPPITVEALLASLEERQAQWRAIDKMLCGPTAVPLLSATSATSDELEIDADAWSLLCKVDGLRTVAELAKDCGFTLFEAGQVISSLVQAGLLDVAEGLTGPEPAAAEVAMDEDELLVFDAGAMASRLAYALSGGSAAPEPVPGRTYEDRRMSTSDEDVDGAVSRVSAALASLLGPSTASDDVFSGRTAAKPVEPVVDDTPAGRKKAERARLAAARRERDAEELAAAQAELEAARAVEQQRQQDLARTGKMAPVVDLGEKRRGRDADEVAEAARREGEARLAEEARAFAEEARIAEEQRHAEEARVAEEQRLAEEARIAKEAQQAEAHRLVQEARVAEEQRLAEEQRFAQEARIAEEQRLAEEARITQGAGAPRPDGAGAAHAFAELSAAAAAVNVPAPSTQANPLPADAPAEEDEPYPTYDRQDTDTASLLRELSSLGLEDEPSPRTPTRPASPTGGRPVATAPPKKKKGLFGR